MEEEKKIPVFTVVKNGGILKNIFLLDHQETEEMLVVGRHPDCNIRLEHPSISRFHLRIHSNPSQHSLSVVDLSSVHGTWISGKKIESGVRVELKEGDRMMLGGSSRVYRLHWVPVSRAYDLENPFVPPLGDSESAEATLEEQQQDESGFSLQDDQIQKEDDDMVQGLDSSFSGMSLFPCVRSFTPPAPSMPEQMSSLSPDDVVNSLLHPAYQPDKANSAPQALLASGHSQTENGDGTLARCSSILSRRGKLPSVQIQTGRDRTMNGKADTETEVESFNHERGGLESVSKALFASGNNDKDDDVFTTSKENDTPSSLFLGSMKNNDKDEDAFTPSKDNDTPSSLFLGSMKKSCLSNGSAGKSLLSNMDENDEEISTPDKENMTPNTRLLRSIKKMDIQHQIEHPKLFTSSTLKNVVKPVRRQAEGPVFQKKKELGSANNSTQSNMDDNDEVIFTPDKENMTPDTHLLRSMKRIGKSEEVQHLEAFKFPLNNLVDCIFYQNGTPTSFQKDNLTDQVLEEQKSVVLASRNLASLEVNIVKSRTDRLHFQSLLVNYPGKPSSASPQKDIRLSENPIKYPEIKAACTFPNNNIMEQQQWTMVVDTGSLLNKESRKCLQLLQGLKGTYLIIPRTVIRELDCMKRRASLFRRTTEVSAALEWIEDCMVNAKSWVHVQSCAEATRAVAPTPDATTPLSFSSEENGMFHRSLPYSPHMVFASPSEEDHILDYAICLKRSTKNGRFILLSNDLTMKIKAMAEGLHCETAEEFRESLVNPYSERFLWKDSSPRGQTWSFVDDFVLRQTYYHGPPRRPSKWIEAAKGLKLILLHSSHYRHLCSGN